MSFRLFQMLFFASLTMVLVCLAANMMQQLGQIQDYPRNMIHFYVETSGFGPTLHILCSHGVKHRIKRKFLLYLMHILAERMYPDLRRKSRTTRLSIIMFHRFAFVPSTASVSLKVVSVHYVISGFPLITRRIFSMLRSGSLHVL